MHRFDNTVALITGAASGMGRAIATRLASEGATVVGLDVNQEGLGETAQIIADAGGQMSGRVTDIRQVDQCHAAVNETVETHGKLNILGNIAGISWSRHLRDITETDWDTMLDVNLKAMFFMSQAAVPHVIEQKGSIINIASNAGFMGQAYCIPYCASKGGVVNMTRAFAMEFAKEPIRINAIAPGGTDTSMTRNFEMPEDLDFSLMQRYMSFRDMASPDEIAALFAFLASDESPNIHGSIINADSGLTSG